MHLPKFQYVQPRSLLEACSILQERGAAAALLAGGTAIVIDLRRRLRTPDVVVGIKGLSELDYVRHSADGGLQIGAATTIGTLESSPLVADGCAALAQAATSVAVPPIRHVATVGGNLCLDTRCIYYDQSEFWRRGRSACFKLRGDSCHAVEKGGRCLATYQGDLAPMLVAMGAQVRIIGSSGERMMPLAQFYTGRGERPNVLEPDEILAGVQVPPTLGSSGSYQKLRVREGMDFPLVGVAVSLRTDQSGVIDQARMVLGAVAPAPVEVPEAPEILVGRKPTEDLLESVAQLAYDRARPIGNLAIDAGYRRKTVKVLARRALLGALNAQENGT